MLKYNVDSLDAVDEPLRAFYEQDGEKFRLKVEGVESNEAVTGLKNALSVERKRALELEKQTKTWKTLGRTPEEISEMLEAQEQAERKKAEESGDHKKILDQLQGKWSKERADLEAELTAARSSERSAIIGNSVMGALAKDGVTEEGSDLLPDRLSSRIKFETRDGTRVLKIMQADGATPMAGSGTDGSATIEDLVKEAKQKWPSLFKGSGHSGSGTQPSSGSGGMPTHIKSRSDFKTNKERTDWVTAHGNDAYLNLPLK